MLTQSASTSLDTRDSHGKSSEDKYKAEDDQSANLSETCAETVSTESLQNGNEVTQRQSATFGRDNLVSIAGDIIGVTGATLVCATT
ncbi:MAG: hypothetical protein LBT64_02290, partial [Puniceicoccales bacterium]|nr:hypothetical protein [Puniceicoccales bacterium]